LAAQRLIAGNFGEIAHRQRSSHIARAHSGASRQRGAEDFVSS
jgi:hypothetical protein